MVGFDWLRSMNANIRWIRSGCEVHTPLVPSRFERFFFDFFFTSSLALRTAAQNVDYTLADWLTRNQRPLSREGHVNGSEERRSWTEKTETGQTVIVYATVYWTDLIQASEVVRIFLLFLLPVKDLCLSEWCKSYSEIAVFKRWSRLQCPGRY